MSVYCDEDIFIIHNTFNSTEHNDILDPTIGLREIKIHCPEKIIVGHLNIDSLRNKFDALSFIIDTNIDILLISETKLDHLISFAQFRLKGFCTPYKLDMNSKGGGFISHFCKDIPSRFLNSGSRCNIETISVKVNLRKRNSLLTCCYNPQKFDFKLPQSLK